eukprot:5523129-Prymnesium_polylepis.1
MHCGYTKQELRTAAARAPPPATPHTSHTICIHSDFRADTTVQAPKSHSTRTPIPDDRHAAGSFALSAACCWYLVVCSSDAPMRHAITNLVRSLAWGLPAAAPRQPRRTSLRLGERGSK